MNDKLLNQSDIARKFGVSREAVRKWTKREDFPKPVRDNLRLESEVDKWRVGYVPSVGGRPKKVVDTEAVTG